MQAVVIDRFGGPEELVLRDVPEPAPSAGEVLLAVHAAGVNPVDYKARRGYLTERAEHHFPCVLGWDVAGTVAAVGPGVTTLQAGDEVYAHQQIGPIGAGCYAEYVALPAAHVARKPATLTFVEAAAVPLAGLTAWQCLGEAALRCEPGETVLIHAAAGGVGCFAVQLAVARGLRVIGTAGPDNQEFVRQLGAEAVLDYTAEPFEAAVRRLRPHGLWAGFDTVGGEITARTAYLLGAGGRLASIARYIQPGQYPHLAFASYVFVRPDGEALAALAALLEAGRMQVHVSAVLPLAQAAAAHALLETHHTRGKVVLQVR